MHETQYVKALAASFEEAEALFRAQVERLGGPDNWWSLMGAWDAQTGELRVPPPVPMSAAVLAELSPEERDEQARQDAKDHAEDTRVLREQYAAPEPWIRAAWECAASGYGVGGLPWMTFGDPTAEDLDAIDRFRAIPLDDLAARFLAGGREALAQPDPPPHQVGLGEILEVVTAALAEPGAAAHLPFLRDRGPYGWPAHLVGEGDRAIYLMIDMHR